MKVLENMMKINQYSGFKPAFPKPSDKLWALKHSMSPPRDKERTKLISYAERDGQRPEGGWETRAGAWLRGKTEAMRDQYSLKSKNKWCFIKTTNKWNENLSQRLKINVYFHRINGTEPNLGRGKATEFFPCGDFTAWVGELQAPGTNEGNTWPWSLGPWFQSLLLNTSPVQCLLLQLERPLHISILRRNVLAATRQTKFKH